MAEMRTVEFQAGDVKVVLTIPVAVGDADLDLWFHGKTGVEELIEAVGGIEEFKPIAAFDDSLALSLRDGADSFEVRAFLPRDSPPPPPNTIASDLARRQRAAKAEV